MLELLDRNERVLCNNLASAYNAWHNAHTAVTLVCPRAGKEALGAVLKEHMDLILADRKALKAFAEGPRYAALVLCAQEMSDLGSFAEISDDDDPNFPEVGNDDYPAGEEMSLCGEPDLNQAPFDPSGGEWDDSMPEWLDEPTDMSDNWGNRMEIHGIGYIGSEEYLHNTYNALANGGALDDDLPPF